MADRPLACSPAMVRHILDGKQIQDRRPAWKRTRPGPIGQTGPAPTIWQKVAAGDRLWVQEPHHLGSLADLDNADKAILYQAREPDAPVAWAPAVRMARRASRLTLVVTEVRAQRLCLIDKKEVEANGIIGENSLISVECFGEGPIDVWGVRYFFEDGDRTGYASAIEAFAAFWDHRHRSRPDVHWTANPEVVAITFDPYRCNIDRMV